VQVGTQRAHSRRYLRERRLDADENKGRPDLAILCGLEPVGQDR
jgi:hypothetical protein